MGYLITLCCVLMVALFATLYRNRRSFLNDQIRFWRMRCTNLQLENKSLKDEVNGLIEGNNELIKLVDQTTMELTERLSENRSMYIENTILKNVLHLHGIEIVHINSIEIKHD